MKMLITVLLLCSVSATSEMAYAGDPKGTGDVIGREGSYLNPYGHVGMWKANGTVFGKVVEVVPTSECDNKNAVCSSKDLANFKRSSMTLSGQTRFWGARYNSATSSSRVTNAGEAQARFGSVYSAVGDWREGGQRVKCLRYAGTRCTQSTLENVPSQFRCDTFVWFSYLRGANHNLLGYYRNGTGLNPNDSMVNSKPSTIFNALSSERR